MSQLEAASLRWWLENVTMARCVQCTGVLVYCTLQQRRLLKPSSIFPTRSRHTVTAMFITIMQLIFLKEQYGKHFSEDTGHRVSCS